MIAALALAAAAAAAHPGLPFLEDDYPRALAQARARHQPLFIDFWATWCHTCLSMQRFVFVDPGLAPLAGRFTFLSIETEREKNRALVDRFPVDSWPTFLIVDPETQQPLGRWLGAGTAQEIRAFAQEALAAYGGAHAATPAARAQRKGDEARLKGDLEGSARAYGEALRASGANDPQRPERVALFANALRKVKSAAAAKECVDLALAELPHTPDTAIATDLASFAAGCAERLPRESKEIGQLREVSIARLRKLVSAEHAPLSADDRSDALATLAEELDAAGRHPEALAAMQERARVLERAAQAAPDAATASTFDPHRTETWLYLGEPKKAEELLAQREKEMPGDYNPPARLARVLLEEKRAPEAEAAVDRALARMTRGQRRLGILSLKARILKAQGKAEEPALREQLAVLCELPKSQQDRELEAKVAGALHTPGCPTSAR